MQTELAVVISCDWPSCVVRQLGSESPVDTQLSDLMVERWIRVRPGDLLTVDFRSDPPKACYRWWRSVVQGVEGKTLTIAPVPSKEDLTESDTAWVLRGLDLKPQVGESVYLMSGDAGEPLVVDVEEGGEPSHPERFIELYDRIRRSVERPAS